LKSLFGIFHFWNIQHNYVVSADTDGMALALCS